MTKNLHYVVVWQNDTTGELSPAPCPDCDKYVCVCPPPCPDCDEFPCVCPEPTPTPTPPPTSPVLVPSHNNPASAYINLEDETVTLPITVGAYSVNDGRSWKIGALPTGAGFSRLLNRGITLWVAQGYDRAAKRPTGTTFNFPRIERRPRGNVERLRAHKLANTWELQPKGGGNPAGTYIWAPTSDRRTPSGAWQALTGGFPLPAAKQRMTVLVRTPPSASPATDTATAAYVPAGKVFRVTVRG